MRERAWRRAGRFVNLAAELDVPGLGPVLQRLLDAELDELNTEDIVDILGALRYQEAAASIFAVVKRSLESDAPAYWLTQKAAFSLSEFETEEATGYLHELLKPEWPETVREHAAEALDLDLG